MSSVLDAAPCTRDAQDSFADATSCLVAAIARVTQASGVASDAGPATEGRTPGPAACDPVALVGLQALERAEAAIHAARAQLLVMAAGHQPETLSARRPQDPERDCRISDIRAVELAAAMNCSPNRARNLVHEARILVLEIPAVLAAVAAGTATPYQSRLTAAAWSTLVNRHEAAQSPVTELLAQRFQTRVLRRAQHQTAAEFKRTLATAVAALSPTGPTNRPDPREERQVSMQPDGEGMAWLSAYLDIVSASRVMQVLEHTARHDHSLSGTMPQKLADALVAIVDGVTEISPEARSQAAEVQVLVSFEAMQATATALAQGRTPDMALFGEIASTGEVVEGQALLDLFGNARFRRLVVCEHTGQLLDYGRRTYRPPSPLRDHVQGRDRNCRAPGCVRPARYADLDHVVAWEQGGVTSDTNLAALCRTHHVLKTHGGWTYAVDPGGGARWQTPAGLTLARPPGEYLDHVWPD